MAWILTPWKVSANARIACCMSRFSYTFSSVALLGRPSLNSSVPMRDSTFSGVVIEGGSAGPCWAAARPAVVASAQVITSVAVGRTNLIMVSLLKKVRVFHSAFIRMPSLALSSLNTTAIASMMSLPGLALQY